MSDERNKVNSQSWPSPSFIAGFVTAIVCSVLILCVVAVISISRLISGGIYEDSPDGTYQISIMGPIAGEYGGSYTIELTDYKSVSVRRIVVTLPQSESTIALRDKGAAFKWGPSNSFVDVVIDDADLIRIWIPSTKIDDQQ